MGLGVIYQLYGIAIICVIRKEIGVTNPIGLERGFVVDDIGYVLISLLEGMEDGV